MARKKAEPEKQDQSVPDDKRLKVKHMEISDEYMVGLPKMTLQQACQYLKAHPSDAVIIQEGSKVIGLINTQTIIETIANGKVSSDMTIKEVMSTDFLKVNDTDALEDILPLMYEKQPKAVLVVDSEGDFIGYFSPSDCKLAMKQMKFLED